MVRGAGDPVYCAGPMYFATALGQIAVSVLVPALTVWQESRSRLVKAISPVLICYAVGLALGNIPVVTFSENLSLSICTVTVAFAIPLLLFSVDIVGWIRLAKPTVLSFLFCMISVMIMSGATHFLFRGRLTESVKISSMLVGVYVGGTPNMAAIGTALGAKPETLILVNAADVVVCVVYLLLLLGVGVRVLGRILPVRRPPGDDHTSKVEQPRWTMPRAAIIAKGLGLAIAIVACGAGAGFLVPEGSREAVAILVITTLSVAASLHPSVRAMKGTHDMGQFLLLVFCVAIGLTADFGKLLSGPPLIFLVTAIVVAGSVFLHLLLSFLFRIDRDTVIITSIAAIFGPHMVGPVAMNLRNRQVLFSGLASGLVGYAAGNYLGMALAWILS